MIKIKTNYLIDNLNTIIEKNKNYGKTNIGNNKKINISLIADNINDLLSINYLREIIYIDNLERIFTSQGYTVTKEIYINNSSELINTQINNLQLDYLLNTKYNTIIKLLDKYRINFNKYIDKTTLTKQNLIEPTLTKIKYTNSCYINNEKLCLKTTDYLSNKDITLIDSEGNYTQITRDIAYHLIRLKNDYDSLIDITKQNQDYNNNILSSLYILNYNPNILNIKKISPITIKQTQILYLNELINLLDVNTIRYIFLSKTIDKDIYIDIELALEQSNRNPIYYIEHTYAKISSILEKNKNKIIHIDNYTTLNTDTAYNMLNKLYEFNNIINSSIELQEPYLILEYILDLVTLFNSYYEEEKINDSIYTQERLNLLTAVKIIINEALDLIGIIPKEM